MARRLSEDEVNRLLNMAALCGLGLAVLVLLIAVKGAMG